MFLASQNILEKPRKAIKLYLLHKKPSFQNVPLVTKIPVLAPLSKTFAKNPKFLPSKPANSVKFLFFFFEKKPFVSECFSGYTECGVDNSDKVFRHEAGFFLLLAQGSKCFGFSQIFFLEMLRWTSRMHSWFVQFFFWKFCGHVDYGFDKLGGDFFQGFGIFSLKVRKNIQNIQNNQFTPHVALVTWNAVFATLQKLFRLKTRNTLCQFFVHRNVRLDT